MFKFIKMEYYFEMIVKFLCIWLKIIFVCICKYFLVNNFFLVIKWSCVCFVFILKFLCSKLVFNCIYYMNWLLNIYMFCLIEYYWSYICICECYLKMVVKYVNVNKIYNYLIWYEYVYNVCMVIVNFVCVN